ncbi:prolyl 4-hydroxylase subunit alpha-1-like isoform X11 [Tachypleus tridentatus]|uniref:prolyl 4-hydroxylase subunit alpha-1-like isoform X11 n=1 Tax=Tachypleus tridentatus TaxID=6853 RepID=UPI003FD3BDC8
MMRVYTKPEKQRTLETTWKTVSVSFSDRNYMSHERNFKPVFFVDNLDLVIEKKQFNRLYCGEQLRVMDICFSFIGLLTMVSVVNLKLLLCEQVQGVYSRYNSWLTKENDPVIVKLDHRVAMITGLATKYSNEEAEAYQFQGFEYRAGDRIATWMFYLSDVGAGGATTFTYARTVVWPKKGSAAFWWNLKRNGEGDEMTRHRACPVLHGSKWAQTHMLCLWK